MRKWKLTSKQFFFTFQIRISSVGMAGGNTFTVLKSSRKDFEHYLISM